MRTREDQAIWWAEKYSGLKGMKAVKRIAFEMNAWIFNYSGDRGPRPYHTKPRLIPRMSRLFILNMAMEDYRALSNSKQQELERDGSTL